MVDSAYFMDYITFNPQNFDNNSVLRVSYEYSTVLPFERGVFDIYFWQNQFISKWHFSILIACFYLALIYGIKYLMRDRKPFELKPLLVLWNGSLAVFSIFGLIRTWEEWIYVMHKHGFYTSICYIYPIDSTPALWCLLFALSKIVELGDTVLIALRKRPLTFLHMYHHMSVLVFTCQSGAEQLAPGRWFMCMNFGAHAVMYTYYTLVSCGFRFPKWISASVTTIQITQLVSGVGISCISLGLKLFTDWPCQQSWFNLGLAFFIYITYTALFLRFFKNAYLNKTKKEE